MRTYLLRRLLQAVFVLWAAYTVSFGVLYLLPSDPATIMAAGGGDASTVTPAQTDALRHQYGLDQPLAEQYGTRLLHAAHGDLGRSVQSGVPVTRLLARALPATVQLATAAMLLAVALGSGVALLGSWTRRGWLRQLLLSLPSLGVSAPTFWVGLVLVQLLSFRWHVFPAFGDRGVAALVLPAVTLALPGAALIAQVLAKSLRTALAEPYVQTALAKGASRRRVLFGHALRNAAVPPLTLVGIMAGNVLAGAVVVETVFARAGIGRETAAAVTAQDIPVVQGVVVLGAVTFVLTTLAVDLVHPLLDPRITTTTRPAVRA
ncbi:peptide/nickel transport system permease protein [Streptomyces sp. DvalAA-14]|uniref:ABC transporter permease n=1 Tax=unclassified Streptomyces TaxID=2593676 RepID=UPI00081B92CE|nr:MULTISPECIES: ABC transporter permease [unclassified Streptomyces]MYS19308.1 ABC transporter permease subunit [Streptomyces sp. SID4948]SCD41615.1 peptide/nickel transport system permease protein [Streptomyces sp. DvalAA-14]